MSVRDKKFSFALRGFVSIAEGLSGIDLRLRREFLHAGDVRRADVMQPSPSRLLHQVEYLSCAIHVHVKDLVAFFVREGEGCCAMPDIVSFAMPRVGRSLRRGRAGAGDIAFEHFQTIQMGVQTFGRTGHLTENLDDAVARRSVLAAARERRDVMSFFEKAVSEMAADESRDAGDEAMPGHARAESSRRSLRRN